MGMKIKPCPFCGNKEPSVTKKNTVHCGWCGANVLTYRCGFPTIAEGIDVWNLRQPLKGKVVIDVLGGVATVRRKPKGVEVTIVDLDTP